MHYRCFRRLETAYAYYNAYSDVYRQRLMGVDFEGVRGFLYITKIRGGYRVEIGA